MLELANPTDVTLAREQGALLLAAAALMCTTKRVAESAMVLALGVLHLVWLSVLLVRWEALLHSGVADAASLAVWAVWHSVLGVLMVGKSSSAVPVGVPRCPSSTALRVLAIVQAAAAFRFLVQPADVLAGLRVQATAASGHLLLRAGMAHAVQATALWFAAAWPCRRVFSGVAAAHGVMLMHSVVSLLSGSVYPDGWLRVDAVFHGVTVAFAVAERFRSL